MKTTLPTAINTIEEAKTFLTALNTNGEAYHPEDDAHNIDWDDVDVSHEEAEQLNKLMGEIYMLEGNNGNHATPVFCPCEFLMELNGHFMQDED